MACTITITPGPVVGRGGSPPTRIHITGTASECQTVEVSSTCTNRSKRAHVVAMTGAWQIDLPNDKNCHCGQPIQVMVSCVDDPGCKVELTTEIACCTITITPPVVGIAPVVGVGGLIPKSIRVTGTASECQTVEVSSTCTNGSKPAHVVAMTGAWQIDLPNDLNCTCNHPIKVTAYCDGDPDCKAELTREIECEPPPSPPPQCSIMIQGLSMLPCGQNTAVFIATTAPPSPGTYYWSVSKNGAPIYPSPTSTGPSLAYTFPPPPPGSSDTYTVAVAFIPSPQVPGCPYLFMTSTSVTITDCCPRFVAGTSLIHSSTDGCTWSFAASINNPGAGALTFDWNFGDGSPHQVNFQSSGSTMVQATAQHTYNSAMNPTVTLTMTAAGCPPQQLSAPINVTCGRRMPPSPPSNGHPSDWCTALLAIALIHIFAGAIIIIIGACLNYPYVIVAGGIVAAVGITLLVIWGILCARDSCETLRFLIILFSFLSVIMPIVAALLAATGSAPCSIGALVDSGVFGTVLGILNGIAGWTGCVIWKS